ncbi:hypothetical protein [Enterococcus sp. AZ196]|uniref:hypothetical protein n=1 Tax=Enterococcus sp. AZ196 TaxID=2774659 RepID=UPI003D28469E
MNRKYLKRKQSFGDYQAARVVWVHTREDETLLKADILDKTGKVVYKITEPPQSELYEISANALTFEQLEEITHLLRTSDLERNWEEEIDYDDEEDIAFVLGFFGECVASRHSLMRESRKTEDVIVEYTFDSSEDYTGDEICKTDYLKKEATEDDLIEEYLLPKLLEQEGMDTLRVHIAAAGVVNSYLVTIQE